MDATRLAQVEDVYHAVLEVPAEEWPSFLSDSCGDDIELRREVESLLSFADKPLSLIDTPPTDVAAEIVREEQRRDLVGTKIRHYKILSQLGTGGMGEVFLAMDSTLERKVALKLVNAPFARDPVGLQRFLREAKAASALNHPNIITVHEVGKTKKTPFIATEFIDGVTLRKVIDGGGMAIEKSLDAACQVASALVAAHSSGIYHRDIKPENIMLRGDGLVKVLDFGLAKIVGEASISTAGMQQNAGSDRNLSAPGLVMGTAAYMSPEQAAGQGVDARSDIWSLGVVMFELFYGHKPFRGDSHGVLTAAFDPDEPESLDPPLPNELKAIISRALQRAPSDRYQSAADLLSDLRKAAGVRDDHDLRAADHLETSRPATGSYRSAAIGVAAVFLAVVAAGFYYYFGGTSSADINTIAVLPFENTTGDPDTEYLSDGLADTLINALSQTQGVKVIARGSSFQLKGQEKDLQKIGQELGVQAVLTGRLTRRDGIVSVSAELVDVTDKTRIWGGQFDRKPDQFAEIQDEIVRQIFSKIGPRLANGASVPTQSRKHDPQAYELLLKGHFYRAKGGAEPSKKAIELYLQAAAIDPEYAPAYAAMAGTYLYLGQNGLQDPVEMMAKARTAAARSIELDEASAEGHLAMAGVRRTDWDWAGAEGEYKKAIALNPNLAAVHFGYSFFLTTQGRHGEAAAEIKRGRDLDPLRAAINADIAYGFYFARQYEKAIEHYEIGIELDPANGANYYGRAFTNAALGRDKAAIDGYRDMLRLSGDHTGVQCYLGAALARDGQMQEAKVILRRLENGREYVSPVEFALLYIGMGEREKALASLERAYEERDSQIQYLLVEPNFDSIRSDARFVALLKKVGLSA